MIKYFFPLLLSISVFSQDIDVDFYSLLHAESESMLGKKDDINYPKETNTFASLYAYLTLTYDISNNFFVALSGKANYVLSEDTYKTPIYLRAKLTSDDINQAILSETSVNYDDNFYSLNIGRSEIDYDWIHGSMDGVIGMIGDDEISLRAFWLQNFTQLQYNYYSEFRDINDKDGMYGVIATYTIDSVDFTIYDYYMQSLRNIAGGHMTFISNSMALNLSFTNAKALSLALYDYDESFVDISVEYLHKKHYLEVGASLTGENGLLAMVQLGSYMFGQFYLSNQVDREGAKNGFIRYMYLNNKYNIEILAGLTNYDNTFKAIQNNLSSQEIDIYYSYKLDKDFSLDFGIMGMNVDERDPIGISQMLVMTNMVYRYESF